MPQLDPKCFPQTWSQGTQDWTLNPHLRPGRFLVVMLWGVQDKMGSACSQESISGEPGQVSKGHGLGAQGQWLQRAQYVSRPGAEDLPLEEPGPGPHSRSLPSLGWASGDGVAVQTPSPRACTCRRLVPNLRLPPQPLWLQWPGPGAALRASLGPPPTQPSSVRRVVCGLSKGWGQGQRWV